MASIRSLLRPGQLQAISKMSNGCILCGNVGSGKSRTALAYYYICNGGRLNTDNYYPMVDTPRDLYIITTAHKRDTLEWEAEMVPFLLGTSKETNAYTNTVVVDSWNNIRKYDDVKGAFFIFDEQRVVGSGAWVKAFLKIARGNKWILLSATPGDTWMDYVPVFVANGFYKNRTDFISQHVVWKYIPNGKFRKVDRYVCTGRLLKHRNDILVGIPEERHTVPHHEDVYTNYDKTAYHKLLKERWNPWEDKPFKNAGDLCYGLRRMVNTSDSRQIAVLEIFEHHPKLIIFYNFDYELEILKQLFEMAFYRVDGKQYDCEVAEWNGHRHDKIPGGECWVYLVQYTAGAEGWNCTETDTMVFYSQNYSYRVTAQAEGRINRMNTPFTDLYYYHLKSRSGIDLAISRALANKKDFNTRGYAGKYFER